MGGGAWPFLVGGLICLVNSDNERDLILLISDVNLVRPSGCSSSVRRLLLRGTLGIFSRWKFEAKTGL